MTIKRARELLGSLAKNKTDQEVQETINRTTILVDLALEAYFKTQENKKKKHKIGTVKLKKGGDK